MRKVTLELWVGLFILLGLAALTMLAFNVGNAGDGGGNSYEIRAKFDNVGGLTTKAPVMIGGVRVGRVAEISIDKSDFNAVVILRIDSHYDNLPIDSSASILTSGLLGAQFVGIEPGGDEVYLEDQEMIELTQSAIQLESLIGQLLFSQSKDNESTEN